MFYIAKTTPEDLNHIANFSMILSKIFSKILAEIPVKIVAYTRTRILKKEAQSRYRSAIVPGFQLIPD